MSKIKWNIETNRANSILDPALDKIEQHLFTLDDDLRMNAIEKIENTYISYIDTFNGVTDPDHSNLPSIKLLDREITNSLSDKMWLGQQVIKHNLLNYAPRSYNTVQEAIDSNPVDRVMFVKSRSGSAGQEVSCIRYTDLASFKLKNHYIIQEAITDIELFENKKMVFRFFIFIHNKKIFLNNNGFAVIHGVEYNEDSVEYAIQIQHHGDNENAVVRIPLDKFPKYNHYLNKLGELTRAILPILETVKNESTPDRYILLGADAISCNDGQIRLVEINTYPNLLKPPVNMSVNMPMISNMVLQLLTGINNGSWIEII